MSPKQNNQRLIISHSKAIDTIAGRHSLSFWGRPNTTDQKVVKEVIDQRAYQNRNILFDIDPNDVWLDLGANIGVFSALVASKGACFIAYEPEPDNFNLLKYNINKLAEKIPVNGIAYQAGVNDSAGKCCMKSKLYLTNTDYNKYRHSFVIKRNRCKTLNVPTWSLELILSTYPMINSIKMDIEGTEITLLENVLQYSSPNIWNGINKLVFEYSFDVDRYIPRFLKIINQLENIFDLVYYTKVNASQLWYEWYPPQVIVFCTK